MACKSSNDRGHSGFGINDFNRTTIPRQSHGDHPRFAPAQNPKPIPILSQFIIKAVLGGSPQCSSSEKHRTFVAIGPFVGYFGLVMWQFWLAATTRER